MAIEIDLEVVMAQRKMGVKELAEKIDITMANLSILKNNKAKAVRFTTLDALCRELGCQPGDILKYVPDEEKDSDEEKIEEQKGGSIWRIAGQIQGNRNL